MDPATAKKYENDLKELENLKKLAKKHKQKRNVTYFFANVLVTSLLFFVLFLVSFGISYIREKRGKQLKSALFLPEAKITLPKENPHCQPLRAAQKSEGGLKDACSKISSREDCQSLDIYNEKRGDFLSPDGIQDCIWVE